VFARIENQMLIVGHTDSLQYRDRGPTALSNWALSTQRAMAARSYLMMGGMPAGSVLQVVGLADRAPLNPKNPAAHENRRIEFLILTKGQASSISAMFGMPGETEPLTEGVETSLPDSDELARLRGQLHGAP
jgi:chemotaxis protein MotB